MKQNFTVRQGALDGVEAFLSVARHRNFRRAAADSDREGFRLVAEWVDCRQHLRDLRPIFGH